MFTDFRTLEVFEFQIVFLQKLYIFHKISGEMKLRSNRQNSTDNDINVTISKETVDNLKWIEENISTTLVDTYVLKLILKVHLTLNYLN